MKRGCHGNKMDSRVGDRSRLRGCAIPLGGGVVAAAIVCVSLAGCFEVRLSECIEDRAEGPYEVCLAEVRACAEELGFPSDMQDEAGWKVHLLEIREIEAPSSLWDEGVNCFVAKTLCDQELWNNANDCIKEAQEAL